MKEIRLSQGKVALVDDEDFEKVSQYKWHYNNVIKSPQHHFLKNGKAIKRVNLATFLFDINGYETKIQFIDGNKCNLTRSNVVFLTNSKKCQGKNHKKNNNCSSVFVGVSYRSRNKKWVVYINHNRKSYYLGLFSKELEAAAAYNKKAIELYGPLAKLNPLPLEGN